MKTATLRNSLLVLCVFGACIGNLAGRGLEFKATTISTRATVGQQTALATFEFRNTGPTSIGITDIKTSCGCTVANSSVNVVEPGKNGEIKATLTLAGLEGSLTRTVTVTTDEPSDNVYQLTLEADIPPLFTLTPKFLVWRSDDGKAGKTIIVSRTPGNSVEVAKTSVGSTEFSVKSKTTSEQIELTLTPRSTATPITTECTIDLLVNGKVAVRRQVLLRILPSPAEMDPFRQQKKSANAR